MFVMASPRNEGAAIQLKFQMDGHVAALLAMTNRIHYPGTPGRRDLVQLSQ